MTAKTPLIARPSRSTEPSVDAWVLPLSLSEPSSIVPSSVRWVARGPFHGCVWGYLARRDASSNPGESHCSDADLLQAYECEAEAAFAGLRGSFVACVIDHARGLAFVVRDPLGSHPLFYGRSGSVLLFAASPQKLLTQPGISRDFNRVALADHLCHRWPDPQETFFSAVRRVPPGSLVCLSTRRVDVRRYWNPVNPSGKIEWLSSDTTSRFDALLDRAVDRGLSGAPAGVFLSGGLDSISVAAVATDRARSLGRDPPLALSLAFPDPACDERARQAAVARELGLRQHLINFDEALGSRPLFEQALELNKKLAAPVLNTYLPAYVALAQFARLQDVQTIFTGHGGDEWLTVTPLYSADLIRRGAILELIQFIACLYRSFQLNPLALARNVLWTCGLRPIAAMCATRLTPRLHNASRLKRLLQGDPTWVTRDQELRAEQRRRAARMLTPADPPLGFYVREIQASLDHAITSWEAEEQYAVGSEVGVRFVHPYWDPDLIEIMLRTAPKVLNAGGRSKGLVRQSLHRRFPSLGFEQQRKVSAVSYFESQLRREASSLLAQVGDFPALSALGLVNGRVLAKVAGQELTMYNPKCKRIWVPINLEMWVRAHGSS